MRSYTRNPMEPVTGVHAQARAHAHTFPSSISTFLVMNPLRLSRQQLCQEYHTLLSAHTRRMSAVRAVRAVHAVRAFSGACSAWVQCSACSACSACVRCVAFPCIALRRCGALHCTVLLCGAARCACVCCGACLYACVHTCGAVWRCDAVRCGAMRFVHV